VIDFDESVNVTLGLPHVRTSRITARPSASRAGHRARDEFRHAVKVAQRLFAFRAAAGA